MAGMTAPMMMMGLGSVASTAFGSAGTLISAQGQRQAGAANRRAAEFEARQMDINAAQAKQAAGARAAEERRKIALIQSRVLALAAAGGGASDVGVLHIMSDLEGEKAYRGMVAVYEGEEQARQLRLGATAKRFGGAQAEYAGKIGSRGTMLSGFSSMFDKYADGGFASFGSK